MLGGFKCSKISLIALNIFYITVGITLIALGAHWMTSNRVTSLPVIGGVVACGVFLLLVAIGGIYATLKQHQVFLFFYMVILFCLFIVQFSVACACLSVSKETQEGIANQGWATLDYSLKGSVQQTYHCCGFSKDRSDLIFLNQTTEPNRAHPSCEKIETCSNCGAINEGTNSTTSCTCPPCLLQVESVIGQAFRTTGGVSLFFSFTEFIGIWLTVRYRNQRNPHMNGNPSAFL